MCCWQSRWRVSSVLVTDFLSEVTTEAFDELFLGVASDTAGSQRRCPSLGGRGELVSTGPLVERLHPLGMTVINPPGQDGRSCQFLAVAAELSRTNVLELEDAITGRSLERFMIRYAWIGNHTT